MIQTFVVRQGAVERSWQTLTAGAREFLLRGFDMGDCEDGNEFEACKYWAYAVMQSAHAYNASFVTADHKGRISHLRVPFCLAYAKTPDRYRAHNSSTRRRPTSACTTWVTHAARPVMCSRSSKGPVRARSLPPLR